MTPVSLKALRHLDEPACERLRNHLVKERYAIIAIDDAATLENLSKAVHAFDPEKTLCNPMQQ